MKLKINLGHLLDAITQVATTLDRKDSAAGRMYLKAQKNGTGFLYLYSTNMIAETLVKIGADIEEEGAVLIEHSQIVQGFNGLDRDKLVSLALVLGKPKNASLKVQTGKTKFSVGVDVQVDAIAARLKNLPPVDSTGSKVPAASIGEFIRRSLFCIGNDETGQYANLTGLRIINKATGPEAMATDGRIAVCIQIDDKLQGLAKGIVIPHQALGPLGALANRKRHEDAEVILLRNKLFFRFADTLYGTLTLAVPFPNLVPILEGNHGQYKFHINREQLKAALHRAGPFATERAIEIELKGNELGIKAHNKEGELTDAVEVVPQGEKTPAGIRMRVGIDYLMNVTTSTRSEDLCIGMTREEEPLVVTDEDVLGESKVSSKYVLMGAKL
jgi:DNA polymerase III sliding clamp (beta) subunit (PCNA family)